LLAAFILGLFIAPLRGADLLVGGCSQGCAVLHPGLLSLAPSGSGGDVSSIGSGGRVSSILVGSQMPPNNRDRGSSHLLSPPTPPGMRVRTGRFEKLRFTPCFLCEGAGVGLHHCPELTRLHLAPPGPFRQCGHLMPFPTHRLPKNHSFSFGPSLTFASYYGLG
jgi:hypothetical protein